MSNMIFTPGPHNLQPQTIKHEPGPVRTWSFSSLTKFEQCPYAIQLAKIEGFKEPAGPAADRGSQLHAMLEAYVQGESDDLPPKMRASPTMVTYVNALRDAYNAGLVEVEQEWTFDWEWNPCEPKTPDVWSVFKCDVVLHESDTSLTICDWKSGRIFGNELKHGTQGMFYSIAALSRYPQLEYVEAEFAYIDHNEIITRCTMTRKELGTFLPRLTERAKRMTNATHFPANPSKHNCKWCRYRDEVRREDGQPACQWGVIG